MDDEGKNKQFEYTELINPVFNNWKMKKILEVIVRVAKTDCAILIIGETGTGKDLLARLIHQISLRNKTGRFIDLNCAVFNDDMLESALFGHLRGAYTGAENSRTGFLKDADHGTLYLDEIGLTSLCMQKKLLKALERKEFYPLGSGSVVKSDFRLICATNEDLDALVQNKSFRDDLFYRIDFLQIKIPPLRERLDDLPFLVRKFLNDLCLRLVDISDELMEIFKKYRWPGNLRELRNVLDAARIFLDEGETLIQLKHIPEDKLKRFENNSSDSIPLTMNERIIKLKKETVRDKLKEHQGDLKKIAAELDISDDTLRRIIKSLTDKDK